jgi:outer membrane protein OmpA-like peptidoglycan-associated protein
MGARRAQEVRDYMVLLGVPAMQLSVTSLGKERPGAPRAVTVLVR